MWDSFEKEVRRISLIRFLLSKLIYVNIKTMAVIWCGPFRIDSLNRAVLMVISVD